MRFFIKYFIIFFVALNCFSQELKVIDFYMDQSDLTANQYGTIVFDQNGEKCALIKIITTGTDFRFDVGSLGISKVEQRTGEIWLYVPFGIKRIKLNHQKYGYCEYPLSIGIEKARTYVMKLYTKGISSDINEQFGQISVESDPDGASVFLDGINVGFTPYYFEYIIPGKHQVSIRKEGYYDTESVVNIQIGKNSSLKEKLVKSCDITRFENKIDITTKGITFSMIKVIGGTFYMGGSSEQKKPKVDEVPVHRVTLSDYYIGETEVTNELWSAIMGNNPSIEFSQPTKPVNNVTWYDCQKFINRLSSLTGIKFSLPTEAQWEYAARGGKKSKNCQYSGSDNVQDVAWYKGNSKGILREVKKLMPNELGLYDMSGNAYEWCSDWYGLYKDIDMKDPQGPTSGSYKVNRGASAGEKEQLTRVSCRFNDSPNAKYQALGLRLVAVE